MGNLFAELKRRHIYRVAAAYAVVAWVLIQLVANITPMLNLPGWVGTAVLILLLAGFPVALLFAWISQLAPADGATTRAAAGKLDWLLVGALVVVIALVSYQQFAPTPGATTAQQSAPANDSPSTGVISIAVLPFVNLSSDPEQEFFSDGMTEEITSALAKVQSLRVVGRTSAFEFKGQNKDLRAIGQALGTTHLLEGSVRKSGSRVRITAQLIRADDGTHLWTENYDRELTDIFATQDDIAQAIAGALRVPLGLKQGETLVASRNISPESYQDYLRAKPLARGTVTDRAQATAMLEKVVARDPSYAPAWALLAQAYIGQGAGANNPALNRLSIEDQRKFLQSVRDKAEKAAREAIRLDPRSALGYGVLARSTSRQRKYAAADDLFKQALALDPNEPDTLYNWLQTLGGEGRNKEQLSVLEKLRTLEPNVPQYNRHFVSVMIVNGRNEEALEIAKSIPNSNIDLAAAYAAAGRFGEAADTLLLIPVDDPSRPFAADAARLLRSAPAKAKSPEALPALGNLNFVYAYVGDFSPILDSFESSLAALGGIDIQQWSPAYAPMRKTERFKDYLRKSGLVDYWRARGWPDICHPVGADDLACE